MGPSSFAVEVESRTPDDALASHSGTFSALLLRFAIPAFVFLMPLMVWPGLARPFSAPKLYAWCGVSLVIAAGVAATDRYRRLHAKSTPLVLLSALVTCVGLSAGVSASADLAALALVVTAIAWFIVLFTLRAETSSLGVTLAASASAIAAVALLQFAGFFPFQSAGWVGVGGTDSRMRVYATLGNPNFVGAFLAGTLPLTIALALQSTRRHLLSAAALLQGLAIIATGSRAAAIGVCIACVMVLGHKAQRGTWLRPALGMAAAVSVALLVLSFSPARAVGETVQGRLYVWRVALPQLSSVPLFGHGPGAFEGQFGKWQQHHIVSPQASADLRFVAPFDHAHNDLLEWTVEYGWAALIAAVACFALFGIAARRAARSSTVGPGAFAGVCALAIISLVDFPFHRPAELFLATTLMALCFRAEPGRPKAETAS